MEPKLSTIASTISLVALVAIAWLFGNAYGKDMLRLDIINACIERNAKVESGKVRPLCQDQYEKLLSTRAD